MGKDMMHRFDLFQPTDIPNALTLLERYQKNGWRLAGGQDSFDWFKDRAKQPEAVIDLSGIEALKGVREIESGIEIGALTTLSEITQNALIKANHPILAQAAALVASPQIRNQATIGGNVCQDTRCWYYRYGLDCYRAGGITCFANTPEGLNREHCLFGAAGCVAVTPSDTAPVFVALEAEMVAIGPNGERIIPSAEFFIGPATDITRMTSLEPDEILTSIRIPNKWVGAAFYFEKVADRNTWDFALVNIAALIKTSGANIKDASVVCGGVECVPHRLAGVEDIARGSARDTETFELAASVAARNAFPLNYNHFKIPLMENLVRRALRDASFA